MNNESIYGLSGQEEALAIKTLKKQAAIKQQEEMRVFFALYPMTTYKVVDGEMVLVFKGEASLRRIANELARRVDDLRPKSKIV